VNGVVKSGKEQTFIMTAILVATESGCRVILNVFRGRTRFSGFLGDGRNFP
jgi:hypothetical protein